MDQMFVSHLLILFLNFLFYIGVQLINNVVIVSGGRQSDSVIHVHVSILYFLKNFLLYIEVQLINKQCCDCFRWTAKGLSDTRICCPPNSLPIQAAV